MPLISIERLHGDVRLGLWHITESLEDLAMGYPEVHDLLLPGWHTQRKLETFAVYALLFAMTGNRNLRIAHDDMGHPYVSGWNISISHTRGYAAVILSKAFSVGVDIEYRSNRVSRVVERFVRADESAGVLDEQLLVWCAKETAYKFFSHQDLEYFDMRVKPVIRKHLQLDGIEGERQGAAELENLKTGDVLMVAFRNNPSYMLTYAFSCQGRIPVDEQLSGNAEFFG